MQKFSSIFIRVAVGLAILIGLFAIFYPAPQKEEVTPEQGVAQVVPKAATVSVIIDTGEAMQKFPAVPYQDGMTVFSALQVLASSSSIQLSTKDYGGEMGVFIESINGVGPGDKTRWWQFWVNNEYSTVGASAYVLRPSDEVVFEFLGAEPKSAVDEYE